MRPLLPCLFFALACAGTGSSPSVVREPEPAEPEPTIRELDAYGFAPNAYPTLEGTVYMGVDDGRLREQPVPDAPVVAEIRLGSEVTVLEVASEPTRVVDRLQRWLKVRSGEHEGYVFGALLTPYGGTTFDEMKGELPWAVTYAPEGQPRVRLQLEEGVQSIDLRPTDPFVPGRISGEARVWGDFGTEIEVEVCPWEGGDCATAIARLHGESLTQDTVPDLDRYAPTLIESPRCDGARSVTVAEQEPQERFTIELPPSMMEAGDVRCVNAGTLGSPLEGRTLIDCAMPTGGKVFKPHFETARFAEVDAHHWERLPCASTMAASNLVPHLQERGIRVTDRDGVTLEGRFGSIALEPPFRLVRHELEDLRERGPVVFEHPSLGPVHRNAQGELVVPQPQGHLTLAWDPQVPDYLASLPSCAGDIELANVGIELPDGTTPEPNRVHDGVQLYDLPPSLLAKKVATSKLDVLGQVETPWLLARPHDQWLLLTHEQLKPPLLCEPIIYLRADPPRRFQLDLDEGIDVHGRWPTAPWSGLALPDGRVRIDGRTLPHLFWDGDVGPLPRPQHGWSIPNDRPSLARVLHQAGLRDREIDEALEAWAPILPDAPWLWVGVHEDVDARAPLHLEPPADTVIRLLVELEGRDGPERIEPPAPPPPRRGFTLVEWGWVQR